MLNRVELSVNNNLKCSFMDRFYQRAMFSTSPALALAAVSESAVAYGFVYVGPASFWNMLTALPDHPQLRRSRQKIICRFPLVTMHTFDHYHVG